VVGGGLDLGGGGGSDCCKTHTQQLCNLFQKFLKFCCLTLVDVIFSTSICTYTRGFCLCIFMGIFR